mmetsp:Transcript_513/g.1042  ORF Transcript_513/g.1042 Transcript_513/m.1042 type:complete len:568 (+) Transcript_513:58-1761(+)
MWFISKQSASIGILCSVSFIQAYLLVSVFPYAAYMSVYLLNNNASEPTTPSDHEHQWQRPFLEPRHSQAAITVEKVGPYAALFATSFMIGRTIAAHAWGKLADTYGRKSILIASLIGSGFATLWFGMSSTYGEAIVARGFIGAWNSIVGVTKTLATEISCYPFEDLQDGDDDGCGDSCDANKDEEHSKNQKNKLETRVVGLVMSMRAWGFLIAPSIAGYLADPLNIREYGVTEESSQYNNHNFSTSMKFFEEYPYLPPNLFGSVLCWASALVVYFEMPETISGPRGLRWLIKDFWQSICSFVSNLCCYLRRWLTGTKINKNPLLASQELLSGNNTQYSSLERNSDDTASTSIHDIWCRRNTRNHLIVYWGYAMIIIAIDEAFPLYCVSQNNGLHGLSERNIGQILSLAGLIFALGQYKMYTFVVDRFGVYGSLYLGCWLGILPVVLFPFSSLFYSSQNSKYSMLYLAVLSGFTKIFQSIFFSSITVASNRTVPPQIRSSMNGLGGLGAGAVKAVSPMLIGVWLAFCLSWGDTEYGKLPVPLGSLVGFLIFALVILPMIAVIKSLDAG